MANTEAKQPSPAEKQDAAWSPTKLVVVGVLTLMVALSVIIFLGSRLGGCMYLDGSRGPNDYNHAK